MSNELAEEIRLRLVNFCKEYAKKGIRLNSARFAHNIHGECTKVLLSYEEMDEEDKTIEPLALGDV